MVELKPLFDVKERLEYAAVAGAALLGEDFRLQRAAEELKPLAGASPVLAKIDAGLAKLLSAPPEERPGLLLDVLALVDAVAYTQAGTGAEGELEPLPLGGGVYHQISYGQIQPLLTALTTTGGGRVEAVKSAWDSHPEFFEDYRVLPAVVAALGDGYGEMADLCAALLKELGPRVVPALKQGFDPGGKKEMARRVETIAAIQGKDASPWLREVLGQAKRDVRAAVIAALGGDSGNTALLLDLAKSERGKNREAALAGLALQDGEEVRDFWEKELAKNSMSVQFLNGACTEWASDLAARGLWDTMEQVLNGDERVPKEVHGQIWPWWAAVKGKSSPSMLDLWRWTDGNMEAIDKLKNHVGQPLRLGGQIVDLLLESLCQTGPGPLCTLCLELWEKHPKEARYLPHAVAASLLTRPAAEVYDTFSPYVLTTKPLLGGEQKKAFHNAVLRALGRVCRKEDGTYCIDNVWPTAQPIDSRWFKRLTRAVWKTTGETRRYARYAAGEGIDQFDMVLMRLADTGDEETRKQLIPYLRDRMVETGLPYSYSRFLLQLGGSPRGVLGDTMVKRAGAHYIYDTWNLMSEASKTLPSGEVADLLEEVLRSNAIRKEDAPLAQRAIPWTVEQLRAGRPFPEWDDWWNMRQ